MLISTGALTRICLNGQIAIVTVAGRGIGFEACRSLIWLAALVTLEGHLPPTAWHLELRTILRSCGWSVIMIPCWTLPAATRRTLSG